MRADVRTVLAVLLATPLALAACGGSSNGGTGSNTNTPPPTNYSGLADVVFVPSCATVAGCHSTSNPQDNLVLTKSAGFASMVGVPASDPAWAGTQWAGFKRVEPGQPEKSALVISLEQPAGLPDALKMPFGGAKLPQAQIDAIKTWITNGAKND